MNETSSPGSAGDRTPEAPGALGGPLAARVIADAAALVEIAATASRAEWPEAGGAAAQATALRRRALDLAGVDVEAHARATEALRRRVELDPPRRDWEIGQTVGAAAAPPLELAEIAADVAGLAAEVADGCLPDLRADAVSACLLAEGAGRAAVHLLEVNLTVSGDDERLAAAHSCVSAMRAASERALAQS